MGLLVTGHEPSGRRHDAPPRQVVVHRGENPADGPRRARPARGLGHFAVGPHVTRLDRPDHAYDAIGELVGWLDSASAAPTPRVRVQSSISAPYCRHAASMPSRRSVAGARRQAAAPASKALAKAKEPTWLSNGPAASARTTNVHQARSARGDKALSQSAITRAPRSHAIRVVSSTQRS